MPKEGLLGMDAAPGQGAKAGRKRREPGACSRTHLDRHSPAGVDRQGESGWRGQRAAATL